MKEIKNKLKNLRKDLEQSHKNVGSGSYYWSGSMLDLLNIVESQNKEIEILQKTIKKQRKEISEHYHYQQDGSCSL